MVLKLANTGAKTMTNYALQCSKYDTLRDNSTHKASVSAHYSRSVTNPITEIALVRGFVVRLKRTNEHRSKDDD